MSFLNGDVYNRLETVLFVKSFYLVQNFFFYFLVSGWAYTVFLKIKKKKKMNKSAFTELYF